MPNLLRLLVLGAGAAAGLSYGQTPSKQPSGYVYGMYGKWRVDRPDAKDLALGEALSSGDKVISQDTDKSRSWINVGLVNGTIQIADCRPPHPDCSTPLIVKDAAPDVRWTTRVTAIMGRLFTSPPPPVVFAMSRSAQPGQLQEAVLREGTKPDLAAFLRGLADGSYDVLFYSDASARPARITCQWRREVATCGGTLAPGIYRLQIEQEGDMLGGPAVALVAATANYDEYSRSFNEAKKIVESWPPDAQPESRRHFLASFLYQLAREPKQDR